MTVYARSDINEVQVPTSAGGCGQTHRRGLVEGAKFVDDYGRPQRVFEKVFAIHCPDCERVLAQDKDTFARHEADTPLTPDEQRQAARETETGNSLMKHIASAMADGAAAAIREAGGPNRIADHVL